MSDPEDRGVDWWEQLDQEAQQYGWPHVEQEGRPE